MIKTIFIALTLTLGIFISSVSSAYQFVDSEQITFTKQDYLGQWVLFNFWAPWCPICRFEIPDLNELNKLENVVVIGVAVDYGIDTQSAASTITRWGMQYERHVFAGSSRDPKSPIHQIGSTIGYPTTYLLDPNGDVAFYKAGPIQSESILRFIRNYRK